MIQNVRVMIKTANTFKKFIFFTFFAAISIGLAHWVSCRHKQLPQGFIETARENNGDKTSQNIVCFYQENIGSKNLTVQSYYEQQLQAEADELWDELTALIDVEKDVILQAKDRIKAQDGARKKRSNKNSLSTSVIELAHTVMDDFAIDKNSLAIIQGDSTCVEPNLLVICENQLRSMPKQGARSVLAHEMIHMLCEDNYTRQAIDQFCRKKRINPARISRDHIYYKLMRFEEMRADILSSLKDISYAHGALESLNTILAHDTSDFPSHPRTSERLEVVQKIADLLAYEQSQPKSL